MLTRSARAASLGGMGGKERRVVETVVGELR
jgi:hypothetical protein